VKRLLLPLVLAGVLTAAFAMPVSAQTDCTNVGRGGAAALVALVQVNIGGVGVNACEVDVDVLNNSLNNLLRNADVHVLENILNNSPILSGNDIDVDVEENIITISVLSGPTLNVGDNLTISL
jgi:predicted PurR-regulated permease PerM